MLADYVPGTPGAAWSDQELAETKDKLVYIMEDPEKAIKQVNIKYKISLVCRFFIIFLKRLELLFRLY